MRQQPQLNRSNSTLPDNWNHLRFWKTVWPSVLGRVTRSENYVPPRPLWFKALELTPPSKVKVVIVGDSPNGKEGVANGLAFSCRAGIQGTHIPQDTRNLIEEARRTFDLRPPRCGDLSEWAQRGCLLLNASITAGPRGPHQDVGWGYLCFEVLRYLSDRGDQIAFVFCGNQAAEYQAAVDPNKHLVVVADHPGSPTLGSTDGWSSQRVFGKLAEYNPELGADFWRL